MAQIQMQQVLIKLQHITQLADLPADIILTNIEHLQTSIFLQYLEKQLGTLRRYQVPVKVQLVDIRFAFQKF